MSLIYDVDFNIGTRVLSLLDKAGNVISSCEVPSNEVDDITKPLTFRAKQDGSTVRIYRYGSPEGAFETSTDGGNTWTNYTSITLNTGEEVSFRAKANRTSVPNYNAYFYFIMTGKIEAWHNVMSMIRTNDFATYESVGDSAFYQLFKDCTSLTKAPVLPATTLEQNCYYYMFKGCTSLTKAPELPATTLAVQCYIGMFRGCTSLTKAPALPATTLAQSCYQNMFNGCTSLTEAPALPATTLAKSCYNGMFNGCTSLVKAPELPTTTLSDSCYNGMFKDCSSLNEVRCEIPSSYSPYDISSYAKDWLSNVSSTGTFYTNADANWPSGASGIPASWTRVPERDPALDDPAKPLTFRATKNGSTVKLDQYYSISGTFQTSRDGGNTWEDYTLDTAITLNNGDEVSFRAKANRTQGQYYNAYFYFIMTGKIEAWHNVMSMIRTSDFSTYNIVERELLQYLFKDCTSLVKAPALPATRLYMHCYDNMFSGCTSLVKAPVLPATTFDSSCYEDMFNGCTSLTEAPALPATSLSAYCYRSMFKGCRSLTKAPELPATSLSSSCYASMFDGCTSLTKAPELPATTLSDNCYYSMFGGCTSLVKAPELPVTTLKEGCYGFMFDGCTSLTKAPELPATTLAKKCYVGMFRGCRRLNEVHCQMPPTISAGDIPTYTADWGSDTFPWLSNVSSTGTFYTNADAKWPSGTSGIPENWSRVPDGGDTTKPLTFKAKQDNSTVKLTKNGTPSGEFQTSTDGGKTWTDYTIDDVISLNTWDEVSFRAKSDRTSAQTQLDYFSFQMTGKIEAWHNVMSLYRTNDFATYESVLGYSFYRLFYGCTSLTKVPVLPATTLANDCYNGMFYGCTSLTKVPVLPATTLAYSCYNGMFYGCTSLTRAPELPATTLATLCYGFMFYGCTSLTEAPALSATTLAISCYDRMFYGCTSLTKAPALDATTLADLCYYSMFGGCTSLNEVRCKIPSKYSSSQISSYAEEWLSNVSSTGTFYTNADANWPSGASGIPENWQRVNKEAPAVDDTTKPLTFVAIQDNSTVTLTKNGTPSGAFQTSTDGGSTWVDYTIGTAITLNIWDEVAFRAKSDRTSAQTTGSYFQFKITGKIEAWHNVMSLYRTNDFATYKSVVDYAFACLFKNCESLTKAPVLPATTLADSCYWSLFHGCGLLTKAPELPATELIIDCYYTMFQGCRSLKEVRVSATTTASRALTMWLSYVSETGDFYCDPNATIFPSGESGCPSGWTRHALADYPTTP